jgi:N-methylhydantoinase A
VAEVQIINLRGVVGGYIPNPVLKYLATGSGPATPVREIEVWFGGTRRTAPLYERDKLLAGQTLSGPAVIAQSDTTSCIPDGFQGTVDPRGNIVLTWQEES